MKGINKQAIKKTSREFLVFFAVLMTLILAVWGLLYIAVNIERLFNWITTALGIRAFIGALLLMVFSVVFYFRYKMNVIHIENGESKESREWLDASEMPTPIPQGRYNIELTNGKIIWNTTEQVLESYRSDVSTWLKKS